MSKKKINIRVKQSESSLTLVTLPDFFYMFFFLLIRLVSCAQGHTRMKWIKEKEYWRRKLCIPCALSTVVHGQTLEGTSYIRLAMKNKLNILHGEYEYCVGLSLQPARITNLQPDQKSFLRWRNEERDDLSVFVDARFIQLFNNNSNQCKLV